MAERQVPANLRTPAPCRLACPAGVDVPRYIRRIRMGRFDEALAVVRERIPFPSVCGWACYSPCEARCTCGHLGDPVAIRALKRMAAELGGVGWKENLKPAPPTGKRVAVVGSGPAGLTAAYYLATRGRQATVFEALDQAGGMMRTGIPAYRLPRDVLDEEIDALRQLGVDIRTGCRVDALERLTADGYDAVYLACGLPAGGKMGILGEDLPGVIDGVSFLRSISEDRGTRLGRQVAVIGGGNTAVDAARSALRLGAEKVTLYYRRSRKEMTAYAEEVDAALLEGVAVEFLQAPVRIEAKENRLEMTVIRMAPGDIDNSGRPRPIPVEGSESKKIFDSVIVAVGQSPRGIQAMGVRLTRDNLVDVDPETLQTDKPGIFAGGDLVSGPASIIDAIAHGRRAAASIDAYLGGDGKIDQNLAPTEEMVLVEEYRAGEQNRQPMPCISMAERRSGFKPIEIGLSREAAMEEAARCRDCDARRFEVVLYGVGCKECAYCVEVCGPGVFEPAASFNEKGYRPMAVRHPERCVGCELCFYACPDFSIDIREII